MRAESKSEAYPAVDRLLAAIDRRNNGAALWLSPGADEAIYEKVGSLLATRSR